MMEQGFQTHQTLALADRSVTHLSNSVWLVLQELGKLIMWRRLENWSSSYWHFFSRFLAPQWKSVRTNYSMELAKGYTAVVPPLFFYLNIYWIFLYTSKMFWIKMLAFSSHIQVNKLLAWASELLSTCICYSPEVPDCRAWRYWI